MLYNSLRNLVRNIPLTLKKKKFQKGFKFKFKNHRYHIVSFYDVLANNLILSLTFLPNKNNLLKYWISFLYYSILNVLFKKLPFYFYFVASLSMLVISFIMFINFTDFFLLDTRSYLPYLYSNLEENLAGFYYILLAYSELKIADSQIVDTLWQEALLCTDPLYLFYEIDDDVAINYTPEELMAASLRSSERLLKLSKPLFFSRWEHPEGKWWLYDFL